MGWNKLSQLAHALKQAEIGFQDVHEALSVHDELIILPAHEAVLLVCARIFQKIIKFFCVSDVSLHKKLVTLWL